MQSSEATVLDNSALKISPVHPHSKFECAACVRVFLCRVRMCICVHVCVRTQARVYVLCQCGCPLVCGVCAYACACVWYVPACEADSCHRRISSYLLTRLTRAHAQTHTHTGISTRRSHLSATKCLAADSPWGAAGLSTWVWVCGGWVGEGSKRLR